MDLFNKHIAEVQALLKRIEFAPVNKELKIKALELLRADIETRIRFQKLNQKPN